MVTSPSEVAAATGAHDELHLLAFVNAVLRQRRAFLGTVMVAVVAVGVFVFARARTYTTTASFVLESRGQAGLQGLAEQLGFAPSSGESTQSPNFYLDLIRNREILGAVLDSVAADPATVATLTDMWRIREDDAARRREGLIVALGKHISANVAQRTGVVSFSVKTTSADLSAMLARRIIAELNRFNLVSHQTQASAQRRFTEQRRDEVLAELRAAEAALLAFTVANRNPILAPPLQVQRDRLQREVELRQQLYGTLAEAVEQARIEEVRDTPVLSMVEQPRPPVLPDSRGVASSLALALLFGGFTGALISILRDRGSIADRRVEEFRALRQAAMSDLRRPWRLFKPSA